MRLMNCFLLSSFSLFLILQCRTLYMIAMINTSRKMAINTPTMAAAKFPTTECCIQCWVQFKSNDFKLHYIRRSEEHTSELKSRGHLVCRLLLEKITMGLRGGARAPCAPSGSATVSFRRRVRIAGGRFWCAACNSVNRTCSTCTLL